MVKEKRPDVFRISVSESATAALPEAVRFVLPAIKSGHWLVTFTSPNPADTEYLGRNHRLVATLARFLMEQALTKGDKAVASRCGVIRTKSVKRLTTVALLTKTNKEGKVEPDTRELSDAERADSGTVVAPRYWVRAGEVEDRLIKIDKGGNVAWRWERRWLLGWRDIARSTDTRTMIASVIAPPCCEGGVLVAYPLSQSAKQASLLLANWNSFVFDFVTRQKVGGTHLKYFTMKQLPVLPSLAFADPCPWGWDAGKAEMKGSDSSKRGREASLGEEGRTLADWIAPRVLELVYTAHDLVGFARDLGHVEADGVTAKPPFPWDPVRRAQLRAELDAAFFHLYGVNRDDAAYIMDTFTVFKGRDEERNGGVYKTKETILRIYDEMASAMTTQAAPPRVAVPESPVKKRHGALRAEHVLRRITPNYADRYKRCVPRTDLQAAAGAFGDEQAPEFEEWVEISSARPLVKGMFVAQVVGRSMEPLIPDGAYCLFQRKAPQVRNGAIVLCELVGARDADSGGRFTVKKLSVTNQVVDHEPRRIVTLIPENPEFPPMPVEEDNVKLVAEFLEVLRPLDGIDVVSMREHGS